MKKKVTVIFLCLSVLLCTSTLAFGLDRASQLISILCEERMQSNQKTPFFSLTFYNLNRNVDPSAKYYIQNPREKLKDILKKLSSGERETLLSKEAFTNVLAAIRHYTEPGGTQYEALIRREFVRALIELRREERDFSEELQFLKKCAQISTQPSKQEKTGKSESERLINVESVCSSILSMAEQKGYVQARAYALSLLREEGTLELANSDVFIDTLKNALSYKSAGAALERKAKTASNLEQKKTFYNQAAEEYSHYNTGKQSEMLTKVKETEEKISNLRSGISTTLTEVDTLAGQGNYEVAVEKLNSALVHANNIGQSSSYIADLETRLNNYKAAKELGNCIANARDVKTLDAFSKQINTELKGHEKLEFLVLKRRYELERDEFRKRLDALKNRGIVAVLKDIRKSQEEKAKKRKLRK